MLRKTFFAPDFRLRVGWRLLLYLIAWFAIFALTAGVLRSILQPLPLPKTARSLAVAAAAIALLIWVTRWFRRRLDRRDVAGIGIARAGVLRLGSAGFAVGAGMLCVVFAIEWALGWVQVTGMNPAASGWLAVDLVAAGLVSFIAVGFTEEILMRGYYLQNLGESSSLLTAILISGLVFGFLHGQSGGFGPAFVASAVVITTFLALGKVATGSLWWPVGWHAGWDFVQDTLLGLSQVHAADPKSLLRLSQQGPPLWVGASPSIEGGLLVVGVEAVGILGLLLWLKLRQRPLSPLSRLDEHGGLQPRA